MRLPLAILALAGVALAQSYSVPQTSAPLQAAGAASGGGSHSAPSSGSSDYVSASGSSKSNSYSNDSGGIAIGNSTTFAEIPSDEKKTKKVIVPSSLLGASADPEIAKKAAENTTTQVEPDSMGIAGAAHKQPGDQNKLHFNDLVEGTDSASSTVRNFQTFANTHTILDTEQKVRYWADDNKDIKASNVAEMRRKQDFPIVRDRLVELGFPKEWMEGRLAPVPPTE